MTAPSAVERGPLGHTMREIDLRMSQEKERTSHLQGTGGKAFQAVEQQMQRLKARNGSGTGKELGVGRLP